MFKIFADAVRMRVAEMAQEPLFIVDSDRDAIWEWYLAAFPAGSNPLFRERTEHDCSCCRHFIRDVGNVVAIQNGALSTIWDLNGLPEPYQTVADDMAAYVRGLQIRDVYLTKEVRHGTESNKELAADGSVRTWNHFSCNMPQSVVVRTPEEMQGELRTTHAVLRRGVLELTPEAVATVADLIADNAIYRGAEFAEQVTAFQGLQEMVLSSSDERWQDMALWAKVQHPVARFRNTVIGTLVQDLSDGMDLEKAVRVYEAKVAPESYKRPTAVITKKMVEQAMETIRELDLEPALERRHARLSDVSVTSVLFVDNAVRGHMKGGLEALLLADVKTPSIDKSRAIDISIDDFITNIVPRATSLQLHLENQHLGNFVSMTAPVHADAPSLFKWDNGFAWSYEGNAADSIRERVKRAGGRVENISLRVSLAWYNHDDLDIHVREPNGNHISFSHKDGKLDVDMNAGSGTTREPVENVRWTNRLQNGVYEVWVNQYMRRESVDVGFEIEIEADGQLHSLRYEKGLGTGSNVPVALIHTDSGRVSKITAHTGMVGGAASREQWGLKTGELVRVNSLVLSPNHWDDSAVGNKHWFFVLEGCRNPLPTRGIYNEFLSSRLERHRKVLEVLGDKTKCPPVDEQMSGVGFSNTRGDRVTVVATGPGLSQTYTVAF